VNRCREFFHRLFEEAWREGGVLNEEQRKAEEEGVKHVDMIVWMLTLRFGLKAFEDFECHFGGIGHGQFSYRGGALASTVAPGTHRHTQLILRISLELEVFADLAG
jgi:hypothetical protein